MQNNSMQDGKMIAIISYITVIGTLIAFFMNQNKHNYFASFHIRQAIGIFLVWLVVSFLQRYTDFGWLDTILSMGVFVLWIMGLISAIQGKEQTVPLLGDQFQEWFRNIS